MNPILTTAALISGLFLGSLAQFNADLRIKYDEFKDTTSVTTDRDMWLFGDVKDGMRITAVGSYIGGITGAASRVELSLLFFSTGPDWRFDGGDASLVFLLNGNERITVAQNQQVGRSLSRDAHLEYTTASITLEQLRQIVNAKLVEGWLGATEFKVRPEHQAILAKFVNYFQALKSTH